MNKCGIICEYNPFHNGHAYHIKRARELTDAEIVCVMSGDFVQRCEPAVFDKRLRAAEALKAGASAVIELPTAIATAPAEIFARGAINILGGIKDLKYLAFGVETSDFEGLTLAAKIQAAESVEFKAVLKDILDKGASYPSAFARATAKIGGQKLSGLLEKPNNILAVEYLKAIEILGLDITPVFVERTDKGYNNLELTPPFASATAIRSLIQSGKDYGDFAPFCGFGGMDFGLFEGLCRSALLSFSGDFGGEEGLKNKLIKAAQKHCAIDGIILAAKSKRYTYSRIKRLILQITLGITGENYSFDSIKSRLLGAKKAFLDSAADLGDNIYLRINQESAKLFETDRRASNLYAVISRQDSLRFYSPLLKD